uniref:Uncharacterized protein n=1 Tax=Setaria italica TaxID=4555 RepID=K4A3T9_SETIT
MPCRMGVVLNEVPVRRCTGEAWTIVCRDTSLSAWARCCLV